MGRVKRVNGLAFSAWIVSQQDSWAHFCPGSEAAVFELSGLAQSRNLDLRVLPHGLLGDLLLARLCHQLPLSLELLILLSHILLLLEHALHLARHVGRLVNNRSWALGLFPSGVGCLKQLTVSGHDQTMASFKVASGLVGQDCLLTSHDRVTSV